ncbi:hypothetical protein [Chitinophaga sp.]|uniref:hypothetical protein n=1 Tax=Chitinophaga sp. TaxID=1869181 RepID=UPI002CE4CF03|nr:hypothetical protein [Chitinophaga sp.]HWV64349.1 hypothetical protein [Chitinophaga sp.]
MPATLKNVKDKRGRKEEMAPQTTAGVPFLPEDILEEQNAGYVKKADWQPLII